MKGGWICLSALPFYGLTLTPEDKVRVYEEIFNLVYNSNGGFSHDEVYTMPVYLRYFYLRMLVRKHEEQEERIKQSKNEESDPKAGKPPARPAIPRG